MNTHFVMNAVLDPTIPALEQALTRLLARPDIPVGRMDRVKAAVAKVGRLLGKPPQQLPAHLPYLIHQLNRPKVHPGRAQRKTLANVKSEIRFLIGTVIGKGRRSAFAPLAPNWADLRRRLLNAPMLWKLSRFIAFCSAHTIEPDNVTDESVDLFRAELARSGDVDKPEERARSSLRAWNRAVDEIPSWPRRKLHLAPQLRRRWTLSSADFPKSFQEDVQSWLLRLEKPDQLGDQGPCRALRPVTIRHRAHQIYKAASALVLSGLPTDQLTSLAVLTEPENFRTALRYLLDRQDRKTSEALFGVAGALRAVATHHVKAPVGVLNRLRQMSNGLQPEDRGLGRRTELRLEPFDDDQVMASLLHLPERLVSEAEDCTKQRRASLLAQVAIAIEIELFAPLRLKNLVQLNLVQQIQVVQQKGKKTWIIRIDRQQSKNRAALTYVIQPQSVALIERALKLYHQPEGWLFPGRGARPKSETCLSVQIKRLVEGSLGVAFNVHMFRGLIAFVHLRANPSGFEAVRAILGDRDDQVIRNSYTGFAERHLIAAAQDTILKLRLRTASLPSSFRSTLKKGK
jgi:integrase